METCADLTGKRRDRELLLHILVENHHCTSLSTGGIGNKGKGFLAVLQQLNIPERTAYDWIDRYKESIGFKRAEPH